MTKPPDLAGVTHEYVDAAGLRVHVAVARPSSVKDDVHPPVVLVHGWPQHWWCWNRIMVPLARDRTVYAIDLRGHGWTDAPVDGYDKLTLAQDVVNTIKALGLSKVDLVGHDWGAWTSLLVAQHHPEIVNRVVGMAIPAPWAGVPNPLRNAAPFAVYMPLAGGPIGPWLHRSAGQLLIKAVYRSAMTKASRLPASEIERYLERYRDPARAHAGAMFYRSFLAREVVPLIRGSYSPGAPTQPVLLLAGAKDPACSPAFVGAAAKGHDNITFEVVRGAGHFIPEEQPDVVLERVRSFLN